MKKIPEPDLANAEVLKPADLNRIHFGGIHTPLSPEQIKKLAETASSQDPQSAEINKR